MNSGWPAKKKLRQNKEMLKTGTVFAIKIVATQTVVYSKTQPLWPYQILISAGSPCHRQNSESSLVPPQHRPGLA